VIFGLRFFMALNIVVAITGASGVTYSVRLLEVLLAAGCDVYLTISAAARVVLKQELDLNVDLENFKPAMLALDADQPGTLRYFHQQDFLAPVASGSFPTDGMVVCPCSCNTLSAIAHGAAANLIQRAAEVHLKERRKLILVPRETPLSLVQLNNMQRATEAGAVILPAAPAFYHGVERIGDLVDFVVARICDQLGIANTLIKPWGVQQGREERGEGRGERVRNE
jgi:flavin prenyltransferase